MPKYQHRIETHRLFVVEPRGNTLIVTPQGDPAGFASMNFSVEHAALLGLLKNGSYAHVLVDLSRSNYFGAKILGAMAEWSEAAEAQGGRLSVCSVSDDMKELLRIFKFEDRWTLYPNLEQGVKALVKESPLQAVKHNWKPLMFVVCAMSLLALSFLPWDQYYARWINEKDYRTVSAIWQEMQRLKAEHAPPREWRKLQSRAERELAPIVDPLYKRAGTKGAQEILAQSLLFVSRDYMLKRLLRKQSRMSLYTPTQPKDEPWWILTQAYMDRADLIMAGEGVAELVIPTDSIAENTEDPTNSVMQANGDPQSHSEGESTFAPTVANGNDSPTNGELFGLPAIAQPANRRAPVSHHEDSSANAPKSHEDSSAQAPNAHGEP